MKFWRNPWIEIISAAHKTILLSHSSQHCTCAAGIGLAVCEEMARKGARVTFAIRNSKKAEKVKQQIISRHVRATAAVSFSVIRRLCVEAACAVFNH